MHYDLHPPSENLIPKTTNIIKLHGEVPWYNAQIPVSKNSHNFQIYFLYPLCILCFKDYGQ